LQTSNEKGALVPAEWAVWTKCLSATVRAYVVWTATIAGPRPVDFVPRKQDRERDNTLPPWKRAPTFNSVVQRRIDVSVTVTATEELDGE
jgi:hypothetical protein